MLTLWVSQAYALLQDGGVKFTARASSTQVTVGEQFEVSYSLEGEGDRFRHPSFAGLQILSGPNTSSSMSIINGRTSSSTSFSFILIALKEGVYRIAPAEVLVEGRVVRSGGLVITVGKSSGAANHGLGNSGAVTGAPARSTEKLNPNDLGKSVFIKAELDKQRVKQGEQVILLYKIFSRIDITGVEASKVPEYNGFWAEEGTAKKVQISLKRVDINGTGYATGIIKRMVLFPQKSGTLIIPPLQMSVVGRTGDPNDIFSMLDPKEEKFNVESNVLRLHVDELPPGVTDFKGAVGHFTATARTDKITVKQNEAINYTVTIKGSGNLKFINAPPVLKPEGFEGFDAKIADSIEIKEEGMTGSRTFTYLYLPRKMGRFEFKDIALPYYDLRLKKYITLHTSPISVEVVKGEDAPSSAFSAKQEVKVLGTDIRYIRSSSKFARTDKESSSAYWVLLGGPLFLAGAWLIKRRLNLLQLDSAENKSRRARGVASQTLQLAQQHLKAGEINQFYEAISKGLYGYLSHKLNIPSSLLNREYIFTLLKKKNVDPGIIDRLDAALALSEAARFSPVRNENEAQVYSQSSDLINELEKNL